MMTMTTMKWKGKVYTSYVWIWGQITGVVSETVTKTMKRLGLTKEAAQSRNKW